MDSIRTPGLLELAASIGFTPYLLLIWAVVYLPCKVATTRRRTVLWLVTSILFTVFYFGCPILHF